MELRLRNWLRPRKDGLKETQMPAKNKTFAESEIGKAFYKYKDALIAACKADARLEYTDKGDKSAREKWATLDATEKEFKILLDLWR
jgi:hypothetical protein